MGMISVGSQVAWAFASFFLAFLNSTIGADAMLVWGWRVPFVISIFPGLLALWGRNMLQEVTSFCQKQQLPPILMAVISTQRQPPPQQNVQSTAVIRQERASSFCLQSICQTYSFLLVRRWGLPQCGSCLRSGHCKPSSMHTSVQLLHSG